MTEALLQLDLSPYMILILIMVLIFLLGWPLEWVPIVLIVIPVLLPTVMALDLPGFESQYDKMVWFGIMVAVNLQTAWLSPPVALICLLPKRRSAQLGFKRYLPWDDAIHGSAINRLDLAIYVPAARTLAT